MTQFVGRVYGVSARDEIRDHIGLLADMQALDSVSMPSSRIQYHVYENGDRQPSASYGFSDATRALAVVQGNPEYRLFREIII